MSVGDFTERIEEDQRRNDRRYDEEQERRQQEARAQLARQVKDNATALAALYGVTVDAAPFEDLMDQRDQLKKLVEDCSGIPEHLRFHFWEHLLELKLCNEGAIQEIQGFAESLLEDLDTTHPESGPVLEALRDLLACARRCY